MCVLRFLPFPDACAFVCACWKSNMHIAEHVATCMCVSVCECVSRTPPVTGECHVWWSLLPYTCSAPAINFADANEPYCITRPSLLPNRLDDVHLLDLIKVMREGGRDGRMDGGVEEQTREIEGEWEKGRRWKNREKGMKEVGTRIENKGKR